MAEIELLIDATEQERRRPKEGGDRRGNYSGRKKRHVIKSQVVDEKGDGLILDFSSGWKGSIHDLKVFEGSGLVGRFGSCKVKGWDG